MTEPLCVCLLWSLVSRCSMETYVRVVYWKIYNDIESVVCQSHHFWQRNLTMREWDSTIRPSCCECIRCSRAFAFQFQAKYRIGFIVIFRLQPHHSHRYLARNATFDQCSPLGCQHKCQTDRTREQTSLFRFYQHFNSHSSAGKVSSRFGFFVHFEEWVNVNSI